MNKNGEPMVIIPSVFLVIRLVGLMDAYRGGGVKRYF